jgi:hypothetical protein
MQWYTFQAYLQHCVDAEKRIPEIAVLAEVVLAASRIVPNDALPSDV